LPASPGQQAYLQRLFKGHEGEITRGQASDAISRLAFGAAKKVKGVEKEFKAREVKAKQEQKQKDRLKPSLE
jgi:hypothetical protein